MASLGGGDDGFGIGFPEEGSGLLVVVLDEAVDGLLQAGEMRSASRLAKCDQLLRSLGPPGDDLREALAAADRAMYRQKRASGRVLAGVHLKKSVRR